MMLVAAMVLGRMARVSLFWRVRDERRGSFEEAELEEGLSLRGGMAQ